MTETLGAQVAGGSGTCGFGESHCCGQAGPRCLYGVNYPKIRSCQEHGLFYSCHLVRLNWKTVRLAMIPAALLFGAGCSGINATKSISPLDFLLPGIMRAEPPPAHPDGDLPAEEQKDVAQV